MDYIFLANLQQEFALPEKGILSRVLQKDEFVNVTLFGFSAGEELSGLKRCAPFIALFAMSGRVGSWSPTQNAKNAF
jgi:hypothetical protein